MAESKKLSSSSTTTTNRTNLWAGLLFLVVVPVVVAVVLYRVDEFDAASLPEFSLSWASVTVSKHNSRLLNVSERVGDGLLPGPEDLAYDAESGFIYTGCDDGWIKRVKLNTDESGGADHVKVENWVYVGGRPLGLAFGPDKQLVVAESVKGLMKVTREGEVQLLTDEADGLKFRLTDGVDVAEDGVIYFTDASYKYNLTEHLLDILEGRPYGRLMSFDPATNTTQVLVRDLYFANGVTLSPQNDFLIFCETLLRRCSKYQIRGEKKGSVDIFVDNLPGFPDNIRYDRDGQYWIALATGKSLSWDAIMRYPLVRKTIAMLARVVKLPLMQGDGGMIAVDLKGQVMALYTDPDLSSVTGGFKIGDHLYYGSLVETYISRLDLTQHAATSRASS
ncbi:Strictosidine synthase [Macleaya cordata]|uniref:Strictosidine synthase n=1 Tax=Macleaya cordata TaxID=56857 RepID=A0A200PXX2_MACCD|nr:Strictosidine synthase [Macleaya cordata]